MVNNYRWLTVTNINDSTNIDGDCIEWLVYRLAVSRGNSSVQEVICAPIKALTNELFVPNTRRLKRGAFLGLNCCLSNICINI